MLHADPFTKQFPTVIPTLTTGPFTCTSCTVGTSGEFTTVTFPYAGVAGSIQVTQELYVDVVLVGGGGAGAPGNGKWSFHNVGKPVYNANHFLKKMCTILLHFFPQCEIIDIIFVFTPPF